MTILNDIKKTQVTASFPPEHASAVCPDVGGRGVRSRWHADGLDALLGRLSARHRDVMSGAGLFEALGSVVMAEAKPGHDKAP